MPPVGREDIKSKLGEDLWRLTQSFGFRIAEIERLTTLFSKNLPRGTFKLKLTDGRVIKARIFQREAEAKNVKRLSQFLDPDYFPRVLDSYGRGLLSEWIEGRPLDSQELKANIPIKGGAIQGTMHSLLLPAELYERSHSDSRYWQCRLEKKIDYLTKNGFLTPAEVKRFLKTAWPHSFQNLTLGLIHGDFCAENMILNEKGRLSIIDIELISVTALAYDLARSTIRWQLNTRQRRAYLNSYRKFSNPDEFLRDFPFWIVLVLAESTIFFAQGRFPQIKKSLLELRKALKSECQPELMKSYGY